MQCQHCDKRINCDRCTSCKHGANPSQRCSNCLASETKCLHEEKRDE